MSAFNQHVEIPVESLRCLREREKKRCNKLSRSMKAGRPKEIFQMQIEKRKTVRSLQASDKLNQVQLVRVFCAGRRWKKWQNVSVDVVKHRQKTTQNPSLELGEFLNFGDATALQWAFVPSSTECYIFPWEIFLNISRSWKTIDIFHIYLGWSNEGWESINPEMLKSIDKEPRDCPPKGPSFRGAKNGWGKIRNPLGFDANTRGCHENLHRSISFGMSLSEKKSCGCFTRRIVLPTTNSLPTSKQPGRWASPGFDLKGWDKQIEVKRSRCVCRLFGHHAFGLKPFLGIVKNWYPAFHRFQSGPRHGPGIKWNEPRAESFH